MNEPYRIACAEIWGGTNGIDLDVQTSGVRASVYSAASGDVAGGDIYYLSVCSKDLLTRIAVADMRGHGGSVTQLSNWLYESLKARMNSLDGAGVLEDLNKMVHEHGFEAMTTATIISFHLADSHLYYSYAGHPPIMVRRGDSPWSILELHGEQDRANLPLGAFRDTRYDQQSVALRPGDRLFVYTDGVIECPSRTDEQFGESRTLAVLSKSNARPINEVKHKVVEHLKKHAGGTLVHDDCTIMVVEVASKEADGR